MALSRRTFLIAAGAAFAAAPAFARTPTDVIEALRGGGHVVYFRHGATTWSGIDQLDWPRSRQRLLSEEGEAQSRRIGESFRINNLPVGQVIASPFARCRDMAEIAFGRVEERMELLGLLSDADGRAARIAYLRDRMTTPTAPGMNRIIVSHRSNITEVAGVRLGEGDGVVVRPTGGAFDQVGVIRPDEWPVRRPHPR